jgi:peptidyl-prolyl cis-trans isomerase A (cyclophilin A)
MKAAHRPAEERPNAFSYGGRRHDEKEKEYAVTFATLHTTLGRIRVELFDNHAPKTVRNFIGLAEGTQEYTNPNTGEKGSGPYYNGVVFHRVIEGFMAQTGDPTGTGTGGPGYTFADEIHPDLQFDRPYLLGMANTGRPVTNGSQFFITFGATTWLNGKHTIFGTVVDEDSKRVVEAISQAKTGPQDRPIETIAIERIDIER